ncbi:hypothetical protein AB0M36_36800 [Actinoplanes sp. NPDC051346]|uniref:hypothetical protein n=1 Tax=Actinoplanes sp. NPDC051346 TaxID=3155048 RepID=UPI00342D74C4
MIDTILRVPVFSRLLVGVVIGAVFGALTSLVNNVPGMLGEVGQAHSEDSAATWAAIFISLILDSGWAWAALAFVLGCLTGTAVRPVKAAIAGAAAGAAGLLIATVAYYATDLLFGIDAYWRTVGYWLVRAVVFGLLLGIAGALARRRGAVGFLAALTVPVGAAMNMVVFPLRSGLPGESSAAGWAQATVWVAAASGAAVAILRLLTWARRTLRSKATLPCEHLPEFADRHLNARPATARIHGPLGSACCSRRRVSSRRWAVSLSTGLRRRP